jgi:hypothetical protein
VSNADWLKRSLASARAEVATWPEWKKRAMRVISDTARPTEVAHGVESTMRVLLVLPPAERVELINTLLGAFCRYCGHETKSANPHHCEAP